MGKILLIGPNPILNAAVSLYLFPQHDVQVRSNLGELESKEFQNYDLLIVDSPASAVAESVTAVTRPIQKLKTPTLWLEVEGCVPCPDREQIIGVKMPIERETFQKALDQLLLNDALSGEEEVSSDGRSASDKANSNKGASKRESKSLPENRQLIDLVDVVEEGTNTTPGEEPLN